MFTTETDIRKRMTRSGVQLHPISRKHILQIVLVSGERSPAHHSSALEASRALTDGVVVVSYTRPSESKGRAIQKVPFIGCQRSSFTITGNCFSPVLNLATCKTHGNQRNIPYGAQVTDS